MAHSHAFLDIMEAQKQAGTLYCGGYDLHPFKPEEGLGDKWEANMNIYGFRNGGQIEKTSETFGFYLQAAVMQGLKGKECERLAGLMAAMEDYLFFNLDVSVLRCKLTVFKPQWAFYLQFGPCGLYLLQRLRRRFDQLAKKTGRKIMAVLDCKPGDIATTQEAYFTAFIGDLWRNWGIHHSVFDFPIINPAPWMGEDVLALTDKKGNPMLGLEMLREGKGLIYVNKTSNPSGPQYQDLLVKAEGREEMALSMLNAQDAYRLSQKYELEEDGVSQFGLVIGATYPSKGEIRKIFPTHTGLYPGFGAQSKEKSASDHLRPFRMIFLDLRPDGFGGICSSSRNHLFPYQKGYGGSGKVENLENDLIRAVNLHRELEEQAYELPEVIDAGIQNPFKIAA